MCLCLSDALANLVGQQNARFGIIKIFNALQEANANKHLIYVRPTQKASEASLFLCTQTVCVSAGADGNVLEGAVS